MAKCYHCNKVLSDDWLRSIGASLMGKRGGQQATSKKAKAAKTRWRRARRLKQLGKA